MNIKHGKGFKRNIWYDDTTMSFCIDILIPGRGEEWISVSHERAFEDRRTNQIQRSKQYGINLYSSLADKEPRTKAATSSHTRRQQAGSVGAGTSAQDTTWGQHRWDKLRSPKTNGQTYSELQISLNTDKKINQIEADYNYSPELIRNNRNLTDSLQLSLSFSEISEDTVERLITSKRTLNLACTNARSVVEKISSLVRLFEECSLHFALLTETWLTAKVCTRPKWPIPWSWLSHYP